MNMSQEGKISWEFLKNVSDALDSYRIRALIDAKKEIITAGIYRESQYYDILFKMFDEERLKFSLLNFLNGAKNNSFDTLIEFSQKNSIDIKKVYGLSELLRHEKLIVVEELYDKIEGTEKTPEKLIFKDLFIKVNAKNPSRHKTVYEPVKVIFESYNCSGCSLCSGICPVNCITINNGFGKIDEDKCIKCGLCYFVCPRTFLPVKILNMVQENTSEIKEYSSIGPFIESYSAKTKIPEINKVCQDGGITSSILYYLFDAKKIELAIGAKMSNAIWRPEPYLIKNKEDVLLTAGTKYVNNPNLNLLNELNSNNRSLALVGVPCMMQGLLKSEIYNIGIPSLSNVKYRIGIFCMESFSYESILKICEILKTDANNVIKMNINKGKFFIHTKHQEEFSVPIKEISHLARKDCEVCFDLTSESADISVGSIGSPSGWNTVIVRTNKGKELYEELVSNDLIESKGIKEVEPGLPMVLKISDSKRNRCTSNINSKKAENVRVPSY